MGKDERAQVCPSSIVGKQIDSYTRNREANCVQHCYLTPEVYCFSNSLSDLVNYTTFAFGNQSESIVKIFRLTPEELHNHSNNISDWLTKCIPHWF